MSKFLLSVTQPKLTLICFRCTSVHYENVKTTDTINVENKLYLLGVTETWNMQIKDLISIGLQVAMGMVISVNTNFIKLKPFLTS